jgi:hypothetical protein
VRSLALAVAAFLVAFPAPLVAQGFDGVIRYVASGAQYARPDTATQITKGSKIRWGTIIDDSTVRFVLMPDRKQYLEMPDSAMGSDDFIAMPRNGSIVNTGNVDTIAGIPCELWHYSGTKADGSPDVSDACLAKHAGLMLNRQGGHTALYFAAGGWIFQSILSLETGILKVTENGDVTFTVISAQPMEVADSVFAPPSNYRPLKLPSRSSR